MMAEQPDKNMSLESELEHAYEANNKLEKEIDDLRAELAEREKAVPEAWHEKAADWLNAKAEQQEQANREYPRHAEAYESWRRRPDMLRRLAHEVLTAAPEARSDDRESGEKCGACGCRCQTIYRVPDDVWRKIAPNPEQLGNPGEHMGGLLCVDCAWSRAKDAGTILYFEGCADWWPDEARSEAEPFTAAAQFLESVCDGEVEGDEFCIFEDEIPGAKIAIGCLYEAARLREGEK